MSYAPAKLEQLDAYLRGRGVPTAGIIGDKYHTYGYHLGWDRIANNRGWNDYSVKHPRDKAGLTNAASAFDVGNHGDLRNLTNYLASAEHPDVREVIGPGFDGRAYRWAAENDWNREGPRAKGDSHEWHCHVSYYRDSEYRDKIALFRAYYEGDDDMSWDEKIPAQKWARDAGLYATAGYNDGADVTGEWHQANTNGNVRKLVLRQVPEILAGQAAILAAVNGESADEIQARVRAELERAAEIERTERQAENAAVIQALRDEVPALAESLAGLTGEEIGAALGEWLAARLGQPAA